MPLDFCWGIMGSSLLSGGAGARTHSAARGSGSALSNEGSDLAAAAKKEAAHHDVATIADSRTVGTHVPLADRPPLPDADGAFADGRGGGRGERRRDRGRGGRGARGAGGQ